jgi:hypothetical protein
MTWNSEGILSSSRELALLNLLHDKDVDVGIVTEMEIPSSGHGDYNMEGYLSYPPLAPSKLLKTAKYRVVVLVRSALATATKVRSDLTHAAVQAVWIQIDLQGTPGWVLVNLRVLASWFAACTGSGRTSLSQHLPRGQLLRQLGSGLLMGKLAHCLPVVARPRLPGSAGTIPETLASMQVAVNNVARSVVDHRREDHIPIVELLEAAKFLSLNQQVVWAAAMAVWNVCLSNNDTNGTGSPVGSCMFGNITQLATTRLTRATAAGEVRVQTRGMDTLATHTLKTWNACAVPRDARTRLRPTARLQTSLENPCCEAVIIWPTRPF